MSILALGLLWAAAGVRTLDPALEVGVLGSPLLRSLVFETERSWVLAPPGLLALTRYPRVAVELPLPQAEEAMLAGPNGSRFGFRGQATVQLRPERWRMAHDSSAGKGLSGVLLNAARAAGTRMTSGALQGESQRPALAREFETTLSEELERRGVDLRRLNFGSLDFLTVPAGVAPPPATETRLLVVGLDGADWAILDPLLTSGRMPNLARLIERGTRAKLLTISPMLSPVVWTTVATGVEPSRHGILDFLVQDAGGGPGQPVTSVQRKAATVWDVLSSAGVHVGVVGWWATWPAEPVKGYLVTDRIAYQLFGFRSDSGQAEGKTWPPEFYDEIRPRIVSPNDVSWSRVQQFLDGSRRQREEFDDEEQRLLDDFRTLLASGESYKNAALLASSRFHPQLEAIYFEGTDTVGHLFMSYRPPLRPGVDPRRFESFRFLVDRYYEMIDRYLGEILEGRGDEWTVMVLSDHGFATDTTRPLTTDSRIGHGPAADWHRKFGVLVLSGAHIRSGVRLSETSVYDIAPTILALFGQPVPTSWPGRVLGDAVDPSFLQRHPLRFRADDPARSELAAGEGALADPAGAALREKLKNLGYISSGDAGQVSVTAANNAGVALMAEGKFAEAVEQFRRGLANQPRQPNLLVNLGLALRGQGKREEAKAQFEAAMEFPIARRAAGHQLAQIAFEAGEYAKAEQQLRRVLEEEPHASEIRNTLGLVLEKRGTLERAESEYLRASQDDPNASQPRSNLGNLAKNRGDLAGAESWYLKAIDADPYFMGAYNNLALVYQERGEMQKAIDLYAKALAKAPRNAVVMNNLASLYYAQGDLDEARRLWERAVQADPAYPSPLNNLAGIEISTGNMEKAESLLRKALELDSSYGDARMNMALLRRTQGRPDEAREELRKAAEDARSRVSALTQLGILELQEGSAERAIVFLREARSGSPRDRNLLNALGEAYSRAGKPREAAEAWRASLAIEPAQPELRRRLESLSGTP